jgi:alkylhydroperoxidase/carboxymuconolactone decarboxylase family protein YurZ
VDTYRKMVKDEVISAGRGPFGGWWEDVLQVDPELVLRINRHMRVAEEIGPLPRFFRHLILVAVDSVVTHLYQRGIGVHARIAMEHGASLRQVVEALEISALVSSRGYAVALPLVLEELAAAGMPLPERSDPARAAEIRSRFEDQIGTWPQWMTIALDHDPEAMENLLALAYGRADETGLEAKWRELLFLAASACPAIVEKDGIRLHARRALQLGATGEELVQTLRMANMIGLHPIIEGIPQLRAVLPQP